MTTADMRDVNWAMATPADDRGRVERSYLRYAGAGVEFFAAILVPTLLGMWLDDRLGTAPVLTIVLAFLGFAAATWNLIHSVLRSTDPSSDRDAPR